MQLKYVEKNLFKLNKQFAYGHCIARDIGLGAGIALTFRKFYPKMIPYLETNKPETFPAIIRYQDDKGRIIYNLITKEHSYEKPTRDSLNKAILLLKEEMIKNDDKIIGIPLLGAGLDKLSWTETEKRIKDVFKDTDIKIAVCYRAQDAHLLTK